MSLTNEKLVEFKKLVKSLSTDPEWLVFSHGNTALFKPYVDGDVLKTRPVDALLAGAAAGVEVIVGYTREEWRNYTVPSARSTRSSRSDEPSCSRHVGTRSCLSAIVKRGTGRLLAKSSRESRAI